MGIHTELYTLLRDKWRGLLGRCSPNYISDAKLGDLLRQWAGEDRDAGDEAAAADRRKLLTVGPGGNRGPVTREWEGSRRVGERRDGGDEQPAADDIPVPYVLHLFASILFLILCSPHPQILNEDLDEDTLRNVLLECLHDAPSAAKGAKGSQPGLLGRLLGTGRSVGAGDADATEAEIALAARYIVERFGAVPEDDEEDDDDEGRRAQVGAVGAALLGEGRRGSADGLACAVFDMLCERCVIGSHKNAYVVRFCSAHCRRPRRRSRPLAAPL